MKKIKLVALFIIGYAIGMQAQVEIKANPIGLLFGGIQAQMEIPMRSDIGMEVEVIGGVNFGGAVLLHGKYYFKPDGLDRGYLGAMMGYLGGDFGEESGSGGFGFGFEGGFKWVGTRRVIFEIGGGVGRAAQGAFPYGRLVIGYRLKKKSKK